jgi:hypothetical protein
MPDKVSLWNRALSRIGVTDKIEDLTENRVEVTMCNLHHDQILKDILAMRPWPFALKQKVLDQITEQTMEFQCDANTVRQINLRYIEPSDVTIELLDYTTGALLYELTQDDAASDTGSSGTCVLTDYDEQSSTGPYITTISYGATKTIRYTVANNRTGWENVYSLPNDFVAPVGFLYDDTKYTQMPVSSRAEFEIVIAADGVTQILLADLDTTDFEAFQYVALVDEPAAWPPHFADAFCWRLAAELADALLKDPRVAERCYARFDKMLDMASAHLQQWSSTVEPTTPMISSRG